MYFDCVVAPIQQPYSPIFKRVLSMLEDDLIKSMSTAEKFSPAVLTNATYFYCKFQYGSNAYWEKLYEQIQKQKESLSINELARVNLALMMNKREVSSELSLDILGAIMKKIDQSSA